MTVAQLRREMSQAEFIEQMAYDITLAEEEESAAKAAARR